MSTEREGTELRRKYHDWCSARIADHFLSLSAEEVYELAQGGREGAVAPEVGSPGSYRALVKRVTDVLVERVDLPSFEEWSAAYGEDPERFEEEMLGFWEEADGG